MTARILDDVTRSAGSVRSGFVTYAPSSPNLPSTQLQVVRQSGSAEVFHGVGQDGQPVTVVMLTPAGAADPTVRAAFLDLAGSNSFPSTPGQTAVHAADLATARPWAASYRYPGQYGVEVWLDALPNPSASALESAPPATLAFPAGSAPPAPTATWPPPPGEWQQPTPRSSRGPLVILIAGVCAVLVLVTAAVVIALRSFDKEPVASPPGRPSASDAPEPRGSASPGGPSSPASPGGPAESEPTLRQVPTRSVVGPTYAPGDPTYTMTFKGWPFAFRTAKTWGCLGAKTPEQLAGAKIWVCVDERNPGAHQKANVLLRPCPTICTAAERTTMNAAWFDEPGKAKPALDDRTWWVETARNDKGYYSVDLSHFVAQTPVGPLKWQVGVYVQSPPETREVVQKLLNDIVSQSG